jgi:ABC-2 type transport system permease protein
MTPVLYAIKDIKTPWIRIVYECNPLVGIFELHRAAWFLPENHAHQTYFEWTPIYFSMVGCVVVFLFGYWTFTRLERPVLKEL